MVLRTTSAARQDGVGSALLAYFVGMSRALFKAAGVRRRKFLALIAAPEGIARMTRARPDVAFHVGVIDDHLNEVGFICPGLGDAGDRQFRTAMP